MLLYPVQSLIERTTTCSIGNDNIVDGNEQSIEIDGRIVDEWTVVKRVGKRRPK